MTKIQLVSISLLFLNQISFSQQIPDRYFEMINQTAMMSHLAYGKPNKDYEDLLEKKGWKWEASKQTFSGTDYMVFTRKTGQKIEKIIAFAGTNPMDPRDLYADGKQAIDTKLPQQYVDALEITKSFLKEKDADKNITLMVTGHSLAGGYCQYITMQTGIQSFVYNSAPLGFRQNYISTFSKDASQRRDLANNLIINVRMVGDGVSRSGGIQLGIQIEMKKPATTSRINQFGPDGLHYMPPLIKAINDNQIQRISYKDTYNKQLIPTISSISKVEDIKNYDPNYTVFVGTKRELQKLYNYNDNIQRYSMEAYGNMEQDISQATRYDFKNIVYIGNTQNYTLKASISNNKFLELPRRRDDVVKPVDLLHSDPGKPPPPPPSGFGIGSNQIGGVFLSNTAEVDDNINGISGKGIFSFIFNGNEPILDLDEYKVFCTSLWAVYFDHTPPGISIDPIAMDKSVDEQMVRYIGNVINTDLGKVMRNADFQMKKWAVGTEKPAIDGFKDIDELMASSGINYFGASRRFWFVPEDMHFTAGDDFFVFDSGKMTLKTEYIFQNNKSQKAEPADLAFAKFFTDKYEEIAAKYPVYDSLFNYAKHVSLASYLKKNKIPLLWFLLGNKSFVLTENSPGTVKQLTKGSKYFEGTEIIGGVDLTTPAGNYVYDATAINAINKAFELQKQQSGMDQTQISVQQVNKPISVEFNDRTLTFLDDYSLTTGNDLMGNAYQTDLSLWYGKEPGLELVRISNYTPDQYTEFGRGWELLIPYQVDVLMNDSVRFQDYVLKKYCVIKNLITRSTDTLVFNKKKYTYAGYIPLDTAASEFILLIPLMDGSFELADKLGNTYTFDSYGNMTEMVLGNQRSNHLIYNYDECNPETNPEIPQYLEFSNETVRFGDYFIVNQINLIDNTTDSEHPFVVDTTSNYFSFKPTKSESNYQELTMLNDQSFLLTDKSGGKYYFDQNGCITESISGFEYKVNYEYFDNVIDRIDSNPFSLVVASNETVIVGDFQLPKSLILINRNNGKTSSFMISDTSSHISYYSLDSLSGFKSANMLMNGYFLATDKTGNEVYFDGSDEFAGIVPSGQKTNYPKSVKQGEYTAEFFYTLLPDNSPVVSKIIVYKELEGQLIYTLNYKYDEMGFLVDANALLAKKSE